MWKVNKGSILVTGVPADRGHPDHIEHDDGMACVDFDTKSGQVMRLHTPPDAFRRTHEIMHTRHTDAKKNLRVFKGILDPVSQITEDCRIHLKHWPWYADETPREVRQSAHTHLAAEMAETARCLAEAPEKRGTWPDFATRLRQCAVKVGLGQGLTSAAMSADFVDDPQDQFARHILRLLQKGKTKMAANELQSAFFSMEVREGNEGDKPAEGEPSGKKWPARNGGGQPKMEIVELPHTEVIPHARVGTRRATSGSRLHRPSLRKPVLPQRLFVRRTPREPAGTILVDASGSMGDWDQVRKWCELAPFGTIAYYSGNGREGWLYVYARNGKRASKIREPGCRGNTVDGPAMDWLMTQAKPRIMITDRGFCDVADSVAQVQRLAQLERAGEIKVMDYAHDEE